MLRRRRALLFFLAFLSCMVLAGLSVEGAWRRFPPPDFESGYEMPDTRTPPPAPLYREYVAVSALAAALLLGTVFVYRKRSRRYVWALMLFSLLLFGFVRRGCICPIGATQNMALALFDPVYAAPVAVILLFLLPLVLALFFGRVFCGSVCPLGAIQDVVLLRPVSVPPRVEAPLRLLGYIYLGLALVLVYAGAGFIICRYDPFVSFFRLSGSVGALALGGAFLVTALFIGRPYCRFFCPYGILLRHLSRISKWKVTISPDECVRCRLCEESCPFGAIRKPTGRPAEADLAVRKKLLALLIVLFPVFVLAGALGGASISGALSRTHHDVRLADRVYLEQTGRVAGMTDESEAFRAGGEEPKTLYARSERIQSGFSRSGLLLGAYIGVVIASMLIYYTVRPGSDDYIADPGDCMACGRCYEYCPRERVRRQQVRHDRELNLIES